MKESFIFYRSFFEAIKSLDDKKRLKMYDLIANFALNNEEIENKFEICAQLFTLIKPQLSANNKRYEDGKKGGRPKKEKTTGFFEKKPNVNENVNENINENVNENVNAEKGKKTDPFINPIKTFFISEYEKIFSAKPFISRQESDRLIELSADNPNFKEILPIALSRLKELNFSDIGFKPNANWLLKNNNFERVMNGEFKSNFQDPNSLDAMKERIAKRLQERMEENK